ncbi:MAG TPA: CapA family protein [Bacillota bacterium]|nr:CapA family protein [Bacillota bacterium]
MVSTLYRYKQKNGSRSGRSLRFGLLILLVAVLAPVLGRGETVSVGFVGDILLDRGVKSVIREQGMEALFQNTAAIFGIAGLSGDANLVSANFEGALCSGEKALDKRFRFNGPPDAGEILAKHQISVVSLANNHSIDFGTTGLRQTVANLDKCHLASFGYGANAQKAVRAKYVSRNGFLLAFIGAVCFPLEGYVYLPDRFDVGRWDAETVGAAIREAHEKGAVVVVSLHWGVEFSHHPSATQVKIARFCIDQGADIVVGHHPHVLQGIEIYQGKPIFYSLGNFIFDQTYEPACQSMMATLKISADGSEEIRIRPVVIRDCVPELAVGEEKEAILTLLKKYSAAYGTEFREREDGVEIGISRKKGQE